MSSQSSSREPRRPVRVAQYEILRHIATGGMGAVYQARDTRLGRVVALKILPSELATKPEIRERFQREARHAASLRHENIVTLYEVGEHQGTHYLAMEFVDGIDLQELIKRKGFLRPKEARELMIQAAKALEHAHSQGTVHRDIKPSNFLLAMQKDQVIVKLTDFGLAQYVDEEQEFRVTKCGTTVGTVDYMSPEQARSSRSADIRSDLYSLGCTFFHMLTGNPPFSEGSLTERLYKHIREEPPDVRAVNPEVSDGMIRILLRLLAKRPSERYQNPTELLDELVRVSPVARPGDKREAPTEVMPAPSRKSDPATASPARRRRAPDTSSRIPRTRGKRKKSQGWGWLIAGGLLLAVSITTLIVVLKRNARDDAPPQSDGELDGRSASNLPVPPVKDGGGKSELKTTPLPDRNPREKPPLPLLYERSEPIDAQKLWGEWQGAWTNEPAVPSDAPVFGVRRLPRGAGEFASLAEAAAAAPAGRTSIIEIRDDGPLFDHGFSVEDRSLVLRAARGLRPLLVWDQAAAIVEGKPLTYFVETQGGSLTIQNLDIVVRLAAASGVTRSLLSVARGHFRAEDCTFSVSGSSTEAVALLHLEGGDSQQTAARARLVRCCGRGGSLVMLDFEPGWIESLAEQCLFVGGDQPLLRVRGSRDQRATIRLLGSTLVGARTLLRVQPASANDREPMVHVHIWDSILARCQAAQTDGDLLLLADGAQPSRMEWQATNSLYTGWGHLMEGTETISGLQDRDWRRQWRRLEGDIMTEGTWPPVVPADPAEATAGRYETAGTRLAFAASFADGLLGCKVEALPPVRDNWIALAADRFSMPFLELPTGPPTPLTGAADGRFAGGEIDVSSVDLGSFLAAQAEALGLADQVVLRLYRSKPAEPPVAVTPVKLSRVRLVLLHDATREPAASPEGATALPPTSAVPLTLVPNSRAVSDQDALLEVEGGGLEMYGVSIRCPDFKLALLPPFLLKVRNGDLRLHRCRLTGPLALAPSNFEGLIWYQGSNNPDRDKAASCALNEVVLLSGRKGLQVVGTGARIRIRQCLFVTEADAIRFEPSGGGDPRLNVQCLLEASTVCSRQAAIGLKDAPAIRFAQEPIVVQARGCAFLDPFTGSDHKAGLLRGEDDALERGTLVWQGDGNLYDKRLDYYAAGGGGVPSEVQPYSTWSRLWGAAGDRGAFTQVPLTRTIGLKAEQLTLERLEIPRPRDRESPGASITTLRDVGRPPPTRP